MNLSAEALGRQLDRFPPSPRYWIAYSGGLDSRVLLQLGALLRAQRPQFDFGAVHVHHGLQSPADDWAEHCRMACASLGLPFRLIHVDARSSAGESPEEAARNARYRVLRELLAPGEILLTAQHRDDQAETLLLQLLRGAGLDGLAAMPECMAFGHGFVLRPLLNHSRAELCAYAAAHGLDWIEDPSNRNLAFDRNFIRHQVVPLLARRWPAVNEALARTARHCAEAGQALASLARDLLQVARHPDRNTLLIEHLDTFSDRDRRLVLREWLKAEGFRMPSVRVLERAARDLLAARPDRNPAVRWSEGEIRRYRGELYLMRPTRPFDSSAVIPWTGNTLLQLPGDNGELRASTGEGPGIAVDAWRSRAISVRYRQGGETLRPAGRFGSHDLKKLFQEAGIPPWVRERIPLVYLDGRLAWAGNFWISAEFAASASGRSITLRWDPPGWMAGALHRNSHRVDPHPNPSRKGK